MTNTANATAATPVLAGRMHLAAPVYGPTGRQFGWRLECSGRTMRYGRVTVLSDELEAAYCGEAIACRHCYADCAR